MARISMPPFSEWTGGASEQELKVMTRKLRIRFWVFLGLSLIPFLNILLMGCTIFCYNNLVYLKSRGRRLGSNLLRFLMLLYGVIIVPLIMVRAFVKFDKLGSKILGW